MSDTMTRAEVVVVGAGVVGAAIYHELTAAGRDVVLVERNSVASGTTAYSGGVIRCTHDTIELTDAAITSWHYYRDFAAHTGIVVPFVETGLLYFPSPDRQDHARSMVDRLVASSVPAEWLSPREVERRFGHLVEAGPAVWEPQAGYVDPVDATRAWVRAGTRLGGRTLTGVDVLGLVRRPEVALRTSAGVIEADQVVLAVGAWTPSLLDRWGIKHDLWCQTIQVELFRTGKQIQDHPAFIDQVHDLNGRPGDHGDVYVGHSTGLRAPLPASDGVIDPEHTEVVAEHGERRLHWLKDSVAAGGLRAAECHSSTPWVRTLPETGVVLATGFNGGAFKLAPDIAAQTASKIAPAGTESTRITSGRGENPL
jgi:glycine/D-amino acid oxidase-like deaminating enzyme